jgi:hypothetical protein
MPHRPYANYAAAEACTIPVLRLQGGSTGFSKKEVEHLEKKGNTVFDGAAPAPHATDSGREN